MTAPLPRVSRPQRDSLRLAIATLTERAKVSDRVTISADLARVLVGFLQQLLEQEG